MVNIDNKIQVNIIGKITNIRGGGFIDIEPQAQFKGVDLAEVKNVPLCRLGNSQSFIEMPLKIGDFVPVLIMTDDITGFLTRGDKEAVSNKRGHINNAIALPFFIPTNWNGGYSIPETINQVGDDTKTGNTTQTGNIDLDGVSTANDHISDGISGHNHVHGGVTSGSIDTQVPK